MFISSYAGETSKISRGESVKERRISRMTSTTSDDGMKRTISTSKTPEVIIICTLTITYYLKLRVIENIYFCLYKCLNVQITNTT